MRITRIGLLTAAMLAGGIGIAAVQTSTTTTSPNAASSGTAKCWDSVTRQVRYGTPSRSTSSSTNTNTNTNSSTSTSGTSTSSTGAPSTSTSTTKPPEAAGLPDCRQ
jgi:hypothetical protein